MAPGLGWPLLLALGRDRFAAATAPAVRARGPGPVRGAPADGVRVRGGGDGFALATTGITEGRAAAGARVDLVGSCARRGRRAGGPATALWDRAARPGAGPGGARRSSSHRRGRRYRRGVDGAPPLSTHDLAGLIGVLAKVEAEVLSGHLDASFVATLSDRFRRDGLMTGTGERELRQALSDLNQRLRHALGEDAPEPSPRVPERRV